MANNNFKVGDMVAIYRSGYGDTTAIRIDCPVVRETKLYVEVDGVLYKKNTGVVYGAGSWTYTYIVPMTDEIRDNFKRAQKRKIIKEFITTNKHLVIEDEDLDIIYNVIKKYPQK